jgi:hypothetical protein
LRPISLVARVALVTAIAAGLVATIVSLNRGPKWKVLNANGRGEIAVDGRVLSALSAEAIAALLTPGALVRVSAETEVEILCDGYFVVQLTPSTEMTLPGAPGRWFGRDVAASFHAGEARIITGPRFEGARLSIETEEAKIAVSGTTFAVIRDTAATCVCAFEGVVEVGVKDGRLEPVTPGSRTFHYSDGRPPATFPIDDMENAKLSMFQDQSRPHLERAKR